jgi:hypothetical protein
MSNDPKNKIVIRPEDLGPASPTPSSPRGPAGSAAPVISLGAATPHRSSPPSRAVPPAVILAGAVVLAVVLFGGLALVFSRVGGDNSAREMATWNYWESLRRIGQQGKSLEQRMKAAHTPEQISSALRQGSEMPMQMARDIEALPVLNVDTEVTTYSAQNVEVAKEAAAFFRDFAALLDDIQEANSFGAAFQGFAEGVIRSFFGDPLGAYYDARLQSNQLEQRRQSLLARLRSLEQRTHELSSQEIRIRAILSQRYNREFPKLD